jgi:uncharacterized membrane protein YeaQ/YmgE (transglycosylase-associated protein family)
MLALIIQIISGAVGGNIAGVILKNFSLGPIGNSIAGLVGGGIGGQLLSMLMSSGPHPPPHPLWRAQPVLAGRVLNTL